MSGVMAMRWSYRHNPDPLIPTNRPNGDWNLVNPIQFEMNEFRRARPNPFAGMDRWGNEPIEYAQNVEDPQT